MVDVWKVFFNEVSDDANAYRAEQLGMCGLHHLVSAVVLFSSLMEWKTKLGCDNEGTVKISRRRLKRIRPGMKCADILRNVRTVRGKFSGKVNYFHVYGHMDDVLSDDQLLVEQRLNKRCDELAKEAVDCAARHRMAGVVRSSKQLLPRESQRRWLRE